MQINNKQNTSFTGILYGKMGNHLTQGIVCCPHGDGKFVRFVNTICKSAPPPNNQIKVSCSSDGLDKIIIETDRIPELNLLEKILYRVDKMQKKAVKLRKEGKIQKFIFKLNELEYMNLRKSYPFITNKELKQFGKNIKAAAPDELQDFLKKFLW